MKIRVKGFTYTAIIVPIRFGCSGGFSIEESGIAVVYDMEADLIATVFKPIEGSLFFESQIEAVQIDRKNGAYE